MKTETTILVLDRNAKETCETGNYFNGNALSHRMKKFSRARDNEAIMSKGVGELSF